MSTTEKTEKSTGKNHALRVCAEQGHDMSPWVRETTHDEGETRYFLRWRSTCVDCIRDVYVLASTGEVTGLAYDQPCPSLD